MPLVIGSDEGDKDKERRNNGLAVIGYLKDLRSEERSLGGGMMEEMKWLNDGFEENILLYGKKILFLIYPGLCACSYQQKQAFI